MKKIILNINNKKIPATLNDTVAAKDFETRLPFTVQGHDSGIDYCCVAKEGKYDSNERQTGWKNGDINLAGGWFALLYGGEEQSMDYEDLMIIGRVDNLEDLLNLPEFIEITVTDENKEF